MTRYIKLTPAMRVQSTQEAKTTLEKLGEYSTKYHMTPLERAIWFLVHDRGMTVLEIASATQLGLLQVLRLNRAAHLKVICAQRNDTEREAFGVGLTA